MIVLRTYIPPKESAPDDFEESVSPEVQSIKLISISSAQVAKDSLSSSVLTPKPRPVDFDSDSSVSDYFRF